MPHPIDHPPVKCGGCTLEIEACVGIHGDWMHSTTRREACVTGGIARPQTADEMRRAS